MRQLGIDPAIKVHHAGLKHQPQFNGDQHNYCQRQKLRQRRPRAATRRRDWRAEQHGRVCAYDGTTFVPSKSKRNRTSCRPAPDIA